MHHKPKGLPLRYGPQSETDFSDQHTATSGKIATGSCVRAVLDSAAVRIIKVDISPSCNMMVRMHVWESLAHHRCRFTLHTHKIPACDATFDRRDAVPLFASVHPEKTQHCRAPMKPDSKRHGLWISKTSTRSDYDMKNHKLWLRGHEPSAVRKHCIRQPVDDVTSGEPTTMSRWSHSFILSIMGGH